MDGHLKPGLRLAPPTSCSGSGCAAAGLRKAAPAMLGGALAGGGAGRDGCDAAMLLAARAAKLAT